MAVAKRTPQERSVKKSHRAEWGLFHAVPREAAKEGTAAFGCAGCAHEHVAALPREVKAMLAAPLADVAKVLS